MLPDERVDLIGFVLSRGWHSREQGRSKTGRYGVITASNNTMPRQLQHARPGIPDFGAASLSVVTSTTTACTHACVYNTVLHHNDRLSSWMNPRYVLKRNTRALFVAVAVLHARIGTRAEDYAMKLEGWGLWGAGHARVTRAHRWHTHRRVQMMTGWCG